MNFNSARDIISEYKQTLTTNKKLLEILKDDNNSQEDIDMALDLFNKYGAIEYAKNVALENVTSAKKVLEILPDSESKQMLFDLADFVLERHS